jgi:hypothetical protein
MDREDIIRMAREANIKQAIETPHLLMVHELEAFAALVAAAEREACAELLDVAVENFTSISLLVNDDDGTMMELANTCSNLAAAIRARK